MIHYRRLAAVLVGVWLGASILADVAVTQNFQAVDRFLSAPGDPGTSVELNAIGRDRERLILRRNAAEENNWIFTNWERAEFFVGAGLFLLLLFGERPHKMLLAGSVALFAVIAGEHFLLTPKIIELGRAADGLTPADPDYRTFWMLHGFYSGVDILKMLILFGMAARLTIRQKRDKEQFAREYELANPSPATVSTAKR